MYSELSMLMTWKGVAVEQIDVKPTMSLNSMVTSATRCGGTVSPGDSGREETVKILGIIGPTKWVYTK